MKPVFVLVCGTRQKSFRRDVVYQGLEWMLQEEDPRIIEGCCPQSADVLAEERATKYGFEVRHYPATSGNHLRRNIEMVDAADCVVAFWDGWSYGTAHTIAQAVMKGKDVKVICV